MDLNCFLLVNIMKMNTRGKFHVCITCLSVMQQFEIYTILLRKYCKIRITYQLQSNIVKILFNFRKISDFCYQTLKLHQVSRRLVCFKSLSKPHHPPMHNLVAQRPSMNLVDVVSNKAA